MQGVNGFTTVCHDAGQFLSKAYETLYTRPVDTVIDWAIRKPSWARTAKNIAHVVPVVFAHIAISLALIFTVGPILTKIINFVGFGVYEIAARRQLPSTQAIMNRNMWNFLGMESTICAVICVALAFFAPFALIGTGIFAGLSALSFYFAVKNDEGAQALMDLGL